MEGIKMSQEENKNINVDSQFPWLVFTIADKHYAIHSGITSGIMNMPTYTPTPTPVPNVKGIFYHRGNFVSLVSLRSLFGMPSQEEEAASFSDLLDRHIQDQYEWSEQLCRCICERVPFSVKEDPNQSSFAQWLHSYDTNLSAINSHLNSMKNTHNLLLQTANEVNHMMITPDGKEKDSFLQSALHKIQNEYIPKLLKDIEESKEVFQHQFREMVIILEKENTPWGIIADDVVCVEFLNEVYSSENLVGEYASRYIESVRKSEIVGKEILVIDHEALLDVITQMM